MRQPRRGDVPIIHVAPPGLARLFFSSVPRVETRGYSTVPLRGSPGYSSRTLGTGSAMGASLGIASAGASSAGISWRIPMPGSSLTADCWWLHTVNDFAGGRVQTNSAIGAVAVQHPLKRCPR